MTQKTFMQMKTEYTFELTLFKRKDPCLKSEFDDFVLADMRTSVLGETISITFENVQD